MDNKLVLLLFIREAVLNFSEQNKRIKSSLLITPAVLFLMGMPLSLQNWEQ